MTRMWLVDPQKLCKDHLLGEHKEMHQEVGTLLNHPHGEAIVQGHADKGQVATHLLQYQHDELAEELERRNFNHDSPMDYDDEEQLGYIDYEENIEDLSQRCGECEV